MCTPGTKLNVGFEQLLQKELKLTEKRESVKAQMWPSKEWTQVKAVGTENPDKWELRPNLKGDPCI